MLRLLFGFISVVVILLVINKGAIKESNENSTYDVNIPKETKIILHFSSLTDTKQNFFPNPRSIFFYYDKNGNELASFQRNEEMFRNLIVQGRDTIFYLFKNFTILFDSKTGEKIKEVSSENRINTIRQGTDQTGFLEDFNLGYTLLNFGQASNSDVSFILRFVSEHQNYDIKIPYYVESVNYDKKKQRFTCLLDNDDFEDSSLFYYCEINYDKKKEDFVLDENIKSVQFKEDYDAIYSMIKNDKAYIVQLYGKKKEDGTFETYGDSEDKNKANFLLSVLDLKNEKVIKEKLIKENYPVPRAGYPFLSGSAGLPVSMVNGKLYVFTSDNEITIIEDEETIESKSMPYIFDDSLSKFAPLEPTFEKNHKDFFASVVKVGEDGEIYILNIFPDNIVKIHKLLEDGKYEELWQGKLPSDLDSDLTLNTFFFLDNE